MGGSVPESLTSSLNLLEKAVNTGVDLADAADEASKALRAYEADLMNACKTIDADMQGACEAQVVTQSQWRSVQFTLDYKRPDSVTALAIRKTVQRYMPKFVCMHWEYCAKNYSN